MLGVNPKGRKDDPGKGEGKLSRPAQRFKVIGGDDKAIDSHVRSLGDDLRERVSKSRIIQVTVGIYEHHQEYWVIAITVLLFQISSAQPLLFFKKEYPNSKMEKPEQIQGKTSP